MRFVSVAIAVLLFLATIAGCNSHEKIKARIFERKHLPDNKLQIKYQYAAGGKQYLDSITMENKVIDSDTITVVVQENNPSESVPEL
jgi:hypothetical protein